MVVHDFRNQMARRFNHVSMIGFLAWLERVVPLAAASHWTISPAKSWAAGREAYWLDARQSWRNE